MSSNPLNDSTSDEQDLNEWAFVDLWDEYDIVLMERFWKELVVSSFHTNDIQPLNEWTKALSQEAHDNPDIPDLHVLLAFKASDFAAISPTSAVEQQLNSLSVSNTSIGSCDSTGSSISTGSSGNNLFNKPSKPTHIPYQSSQITAAVLFEYYGNINCGLFLHMIIHKKYRNMGLDRMLVKKSIEILDKNAHGHGHLAGCNAIFFETKSATTKNTVNLVGSSSTIPTSISSGNLQQLQTNAASNQQQPSSTTTTPLNTPTGSTNITTTSGGGTTNTTALAASNQQEPMDPRQQHAILYNIGFRMIDFDYTKLPLKRLGKKNNLLLTVYLSPHIPSIPTLDGDKYYLPSVLLKNFIYDLWETSFLTEKLDMKPNEDPEYSKVLEQVELREKIPLLDLPWGGGKPWTLVDLYEDYDEELLERCYRELMVPSVKHSEIQSLGNVMRAMSPEGSDSTYLPDVHVLIAVRWPEGKHNSSTNPIIDGICVFEYYAEQNCGLLTNLILQKKNRVEGLDQLLVESTVEILDANARERGNLAGCNAIFIHIKNPTTVVVSQDIVDVCQHHITLHKMGFKLLDFDYYQAPFDEHSAPKKFMMGLFITELIPLSHEKGDKPYIPYNLLKSFVELQWTNAAGNEQIKKTPESFTEYQRMMEQIELRERIPLLDLPWDLGKPWTLVDLWEDYDKELLERFYKEIMIPNFPNKSEIEPLENWLLSLSTESREDPNISDLHILLALRWPSDSTNTQPIIEGAIIFEYFSANNCGLLTYLIVQKTFKGKGLDRVLVESALEILDQNAKSQGFLPGCNAIFLEVYSGEKVTIKQDVVDPRMRHSIYHQIGFRLIDFEYVAPPLAMGYPKLKHFLLTVYLTEHIPKMPLEEGKFYLPSSVLKNFVNVLWRNAYATKKMKEIPSKDPDYQKIIEQVEYREKIPLLDLPWGASKPWTLVDLWDDYDEELLIRFYNELMVPNFPIKSELEPLSNFLSALSEERRETYNPHLSELHVLLALRWPTDSNDLQPTIGAGITFEYYPATNCGLLSYLVVHRSSRGQGLAGILVERAVVLLDRHAKTRGQLAGCNAIFLETNSAEKVTVQQDVMDPRMRHTIYHKMGFRMINFEYVMPPICPGYEKLKGVLLLTAYLTPHIPYIDYNNQRQYYLPNVLLKNFITAQWENAFRNGRLSVSPIQDTDFTMSVEQIELREKIPLMDLPWGDGKDWTIVDLWEDYDEDLLDAFYKKYMITQFGTSDELEPIENWHKVMSTEARDDPNICDLHVLLALGLPGEHKGKGHKYIIGGLVFEYYPETNSALVTYLVVNNKFSGKGIGTDLILRTLTILDQNAKQKGHIAGCNAIFLEVMFSNPSIESASSSTTLAKTTTTSDSSLSHVFLFNKGFRLLDFEYYQPPTCLKNPKSNNVCLTVLLTPRIPKHGEGSEIQPFIPSSLLRSFIATLWEDECGLIGYNFENDVCYLRMMEQLDNNDYFHCLDLPWSKNRIQQRFETDQSKESQLKNSVSIFNRPNISVSGEISSPILSPLKINTLPLSVGTTSYLSTMNTSTSWMLNNPLLPSPQKSPTNSTTSDQSTPSTNSNSN